VASASTAKTKAPSVDPTVCQLVNISAGLSGHGRHHGRASLVSTLTKAGATVGCPALR
jgi:hypothetical protein